MMRGAASGGGDKTPDPVNWADISAAGSGANANQTLTGVSGGILLHFDVTINTGAPSALQYDVNDGAGVEFVDNDTLTWLVGQTLSFFVDGGGLPTTGTVSVKNASAGMVELDSFDWTIT